ncbi:MAG TPA: SPOR domain-containing protein, partial [Phenylobacterium sp.]
RPLPTRMAPAAAPPAPSVASPPFAMAAVSPPTGDIAVSALPPITGGAISSAPIAGQAVVASTPSAAATGLRVQAGAFSSEANAQRAVTQLSSAGLASIEPLQRDGTTLYRVILPAPADEAAAYALRDRVAEIGFSDARVISSF